MRRTPLRRKSPQAQITKELDRLCRARVFARDGHACIKCGKRDRLQWCHVYSRRYRSLRWNMLNSMTLCAGCHLFWHHRPLEAMEWWRRHVGPDKANNLVLAARLRSGKILDLEAIKLYLEQKLALPGPVRPVRRDPQG